MAKAPLAVCSRGRTSATCKNTRGGENGQVLMTLFSFLMLHRSSSGHADSADDPADGHPVEAGGPGPEVSDVHGVVLLQ